MSFINLVGIRVPPEQEAACNKWLNEKHIPDLFKFKALKKATRYKLASASIGKHESEGISIAGAKTGYPHYITVFEFENAQGFKDYDASPEMAAAHEDWRNRNKEFKAEVFWRAQFESIKTWQK